MKAVAAAFLAALALAAGAVHAGQTCEERAPTPAAVRDGLELAHRVHRHLEDQGATAAIVARVGRDLSQHGLRYSHAGLVLREPGAPRWRVVHLLNHCGRGDSELYEQGLGNFFLDDLFRHEAAVLVPSHELQQALRDAVAAGVGRTLHQREYSLIANPWATSYQNSNQWLLELAAAAVSGARDRRAAQAWLKQADYRPGELRIGALTRIGSRLTAANVRFDDHPWESSGGSRFAVVTVESVLLHLAKTDRTVGQSVLRIE